MSRGFSVIELLIAMAIATIVISGVVVGTVGTAGGFGAAVGGKQTVVSDGETNSEALRRAQDLIEEAAATARTNYSSVVEKTVADPRYQIELTIPPAYATQCSTAIAGTVSWTGSYGRASWVGATTTIVNIPEMLALSGDCDFEPPVSGWDASSAYPMNDPIFSGSPASDVDVLMRPDGRFALVTAQYNPGAGAATLWMVDVTDLDLDPMPFDSFETDGDLWAVDAIDNFAFAVGATTTSQKPVQIFDISDETDVQFVAGASLPNASAGIGRSVYYRENKIYVGTQYLAFGGPGVNHELHIFDVTDPFDPSWETNAWQDSIDVDRNVNDIVVRDGLAYLATGPGGDNTVLRIYDVDPSSVTYKSLIGSYTAPSAQQATALYLFGDYVYLGRERTTGSNHDFLVINISTPSLPTLADSDILDLSNNKVVSGVSVKGGIAFIVTTDTTPADGGGAFILYDVSDPTDISLITPCTAVNWSEKATGLDMVDNYAFVSNESNDALQVIYPSAACSP